MTTRDAKGADLLPYVQLGESLKRALNDWRTVNDRYYIDRAAKTGRLMPEV